MCPCSLCDTCRVKTSWFRYRSHLFTKSTVKTWVLPSVAHQIPFCLFALSSWFSLHLWLELDILLTLSIQPKLYLENIECLLFLPMFQPVHIGFSVKPLKSHLTCYVWILSSCVITLAKELLWALSACLPACLSVCLPVCLSRKIRQKVTNFNNSLITAMRKVI